MPWWSWVLIWFGLFLALLGMFAIFAWHLFKKLMVAFRELEKLALAADVLQPRAAEEPVRFRSSLFQDFGEVHARREAEREKRAEKVDNRRNNRLNRAKLLTGADYRQYLHLKKRK